MTRFGVRAARPSPDTIFTTVRAFLAAAGLTLILAGAASGASTGPRVLAIRFGPDLEVNPVTQDYLSAKLHKAATNG